MMMLDEPCPECRGVGAIQSAEWVEWFRGPRRAPYPRGPEEVRCGVCDGLGQVPTEEGQQILGFVRRHLGLW
jgi:LSD1 subclass zinc finger protein